MIRVGFAASLLLACATANAVVIEVSAMQVGGILGDGTKDNHPSHQNYFVGYGSGAAPFSRSAERRSFFWFHMPTLTGPIMSAKLMLKMPFAESLIFGKGPGEPGPSVPLDDSESFQLGFTMAPKDVVIDPDLGVPETLALFDDMDAHPIAAPKTFFKDVPYGFPMAVEVDLDGSGISYISGSSGMDVVLTGSMPSWSFDDRLVPGGGDWFEKHELLFGHSEVLPGTVPMPTLMIEYAPVPEPATTAALGLGLVALLKKRARRRTD